MTAPIDEEALGGETLEFYKKYLEENPELAWRLVGKCPHCKRSLSANSSTCWYCVMEIHHDQQ